MIIKKTLSIILTALLALGVLAGCSGGSEETGVDHREAADASLRQHTLGQVLLLPQYAQ